MFILYGIFDAMMMMIRSINWEIACIACMSVNYIIWVKPAFSMLDQQNIFTLFPHIYILEFHTFFALKYTIYVLNSIHGSMWTIVYRHWPVYILYRRYFTLHFFRLLTAFGLIGYHFIQFLSIFRFASCRLMNPNTDTDTHKHERTLCMWYGKEKETLNWIEPFTFGIYDKYFVGMHHSFRKLHSHRSFGARI